MAYIDFLENHPHFLEKTLNAKHNELILEQEWDDLVSLLNAVPLAPVLDKTTWNNRLQDWRYNLNQKHRKMVIEVNSTGGGAMSSKPLKDFEQRALTLFNKTCTTGNPYLLKEAGIKREFQLPLEDDIIVQVIEENESGALNVVQDSSVQASASKIKKRSSANLLDDLAPATKKRSKRSSTTQLVLDRIERIEQERADRQAEFMGKVCSSIESFSSAINNLAQAIVTNSMNQH